MSVDQFLLSADTTDLNYPEIRPSLDLNFARVKALDPRITFTRSSGGSYVGADGLIKYAGVNEPRFDHDPSTGESLGLLLEESRTNRTTSSDYSTVNLFNVSKSTTVATTAPDGSTVFAFDANNNTSVVHRITLTNGSTGNATVPHTASFFIKIPPIGSSGQISNNDRLLFLVRWRSSSGSGTGAVFDYFQSTQNFRILSGVSAFGPNPPATYNISANSPYYEKWPNGWYRFVFPGAVASNTSADSFVFYDWNISETNVEQGGNCSVFLWGAQFEQGAFPTSYIPTQGSTRTRARDNASITGKNFSEWYRQDEGGIRLSYSIIGNNTDNTLFAINNTTQNEQIDSRWFLSGTGYRVRVGGINQASYAEGDAPPIPFKKYQSSFGYQKNNFTMVLNGVISNTDILGDLPGTQVGIGPVQIEFGKRTNTTIGNIILSRFTYFPKRLPNAQLQALTR